MAATVVWFRQDLRVSDNPALQAALLRGGPIVPVYIWAPEEEGVWAPGGASQWWLHYSLQSLESDLRSRGASLIIRGGPTLRTLLEVARHVGADAVFWNRRYEPLARQRDGYVKEQLRTASIQAESFNAALLHEPWTIQNKAGRPFQVFTPFWRHCLSLAEPARPAPTPTIIPAASAAVASLSLQELGLLPKLGWAEGLRQKWQPGSKGAQQQLQSFLMQAFETYSAGRNRPDLAGTSKLSPHLHFGEISPRQVWHAISDRLGPAGVWRQSQFLAEVGWREFAHHLLYHFPATDQEPLRPEFAAFPWRSNQQWLQAWQRGQTGYPFVDAGMRELWTTGWMHNRVRMVVASFLIKDLLISWKEGARWFWDTLVDADLAQNTLGWQWTAGCGADAAPFFRVFNPVSQGEKFDPQGSYVRRWIPELASLPDEWIHKPFLAPAHVLSRSRVELNVTYPAPIVSHAIAREVALEAFAKIKSS